MARQRLAGKTREEIWAAFVDAQNRLLSWELVGTGSVNASSVHPREVLERALLLTAAGYILDHNHPGGTLAASPADAETTRRLRRSAEACEVRFIDHLIVSDQGWCSLAGASD
jgi:DNA repair protein RadC